MKKRILSIAAVVFCILFLLCGCESESGYPKATERFFVNDFADVLDTADEDAMYNAAVSLNNATTAQVVVVTVEELDGMDPSQYALELGREWGVGTKENDNGIVILLSESDREIYIAVGYGLEGALPDSKTGRIIDYYGMDYLRNDDFSKGIAAIQSAIVNEVYIEYGMETPEGYVPIDNISAVQISGEEAASTAVSWVIMMIVIFILMFIFRRRGGGFIWFGPTYFGGHHTSFRGGGFGGGFGGSSGGFRGGGGSFGGGGAGRGF